MNEHSRRWICGWVVLGTVVSAGAWELPNPQRFSHPGATNVPVSSPALYPDEDGFQARAEVIRSGLRTKDLAAYRRGFFKGGDPGKYVPGHAMARLLEDPGDAVAAQYMNDDRSYKEHYHFAAVNWGRFYPLFGSSVLTPEVRVRFTEEAFKSGDYLNPRGTENHKVMSMTTANVLPWYIDKGLSRKGKEEALADAKRMLRDYVKGLYMAGQGEWDSCTYLMFDLNGMLNVYDFSKDEECRLLARAALDWYAAAYALKYTDGAYCAPNQRGFAGGAVRTIADETGWLWWGSHRAITPDEARDFRHTVHAQTSAWRPNRVITALARREVTRLPVEQRNSKPNYWYGQDLAAKPGAYHETVYISKRFTMGSLWDGHGSQLSRFGLVVATTQGAVTFTGGHPRSSDHTGKKTGLGYADGNGRYTQSAQSEGLYLSMSRAPDDESARYGFFSIPEGVAPPTAEGNWLVFDVEGVFVALRGLGGELKKGLTDLGETQVQENQEAAAKGLPPKHVAKPILRIDGQRVGFVLQAADQLASREAFNAWLAKTEVDDRGFAEQMAVRVKSPSGREVRMAFNPAPEGDAHGNRMARVSIGGQDLTTDDWPIYGGPYVIQEPGILTVNDGREGYTIDFTGNLPVFKKWLPTGRVPNLKPME